MNCGRGEREGQSVLTWFILYCDPRVSNRASLHFASGNFTTAKGWCKVYDRTVFSKELPIYIYAFVPKEVPRR